MFLADHPNVELEAAPIIQPVIMGTLTTFAVVAGNEITNSGATTLHGDLGLAPGGAVSGSPTVTGTSYITGTTANTAKGDLTTAMNDAAGRAMTASMSGDLGGLTKYPGVHKTDGAIGVTGILYLDAQQNENAVWIFQIASQLTVANNAQVIMLNAPASMTVINVFWQCGSSAVIGSGVKMIGTVMALADISVALDSTTGPMLAFTGHVTLLGNTLYSYNEGRVSAGITHAPSMAPSHVPSTAPSHVPSEIPSHAPSVMPSLSPTSAPVVHIPP